MKRPDDTAKSQRPTAAPHRRLPVGAEPLDANRSHFRVWAPAATRVQVVAGSDDGVVSTALAAEGGGGATFPAWRMLPPAGGIVTG